MELIRQIDGALRHPQILDGEERRNEFRPTSLRSLASFAVKSSLPPASTLKDAEERRGGSSVFETLFSSALRRVICGESHFLVVGRAQRGSAAILRVTCV
jgi:hypothetical protein